MKLYRYYKDEKPQATEVSNRNDERSCSVSATLNVIHIAQHHIITPNSAEISSITSYLSIIPFPLVLTIHLISASTITHHATSSLDKVSIALPASKKIKTRASLSSVLAEKSVMILSLHASLCSVCDCGFSSPARRLASLFLKRGC